MNFNGDPELDLGSLVGVDEDIAISLIEDAGYSVRIAIREDKEYVLSQEYDGTRVNLDIKQDRIAEAWIG